MKEALVTPRLLTWARERAGLPVEVMAKRAGTTPKKAELWEEGEARPTFRQAARWATVTHVPLGYLFLPTPPEERLPIPDLRTVRGSVGPSENADFMDELRTVQFKADWYREYRKKRGGTALGFVGRFRNNYATDAIARDMRDVLGVGADARAATRNWEEFLAVLTERAESAGIWVMRSGVVGNNTSRPLSVEAFRGFAISDPLIPLVFVNARDARAAQIFTLAHEFAHLWLGKSGISDALSEPMDARNAKGVESLCNAVAAEFLAPKEDFRREWAKADDLASNAARLSARFRVSRIVIAIRARTLGLVDEETFQEFFDAERARWRKEREDSTGGGDYYRSARSRNGHGFYQAILACAERGELLLRDAGRLLDMKPKSVREAYRRSLESRQ